MTKGLTSIQNSMWHLNGLLLQHGEELEALSLKEQCKIKKLQSMLLDIDSMLDDYTSEDAPMPDHINDVNDVCSKHHY